MIISRRKFLRVLGLNIGFAIIGLLGLKFFKPDIVAWRPQFYRKMQNVKLERQGLGKLKSKELNTLIAATEALVDNEIEKTHYEIYFTWRSENLPGYYRLYTKFCATLNKLSQDHSNLDFKDVPTNIQQNILQKIPKQKTIRRLFATISGNKDYLLFYDYVILDILKLYGDTDAWLLLGYKYWPGQARGFELYRKPHTIQ